MNPPWIHRLAQSSRPTRSGIEQPSLRTFVPRVRQELVVDANDVLNTYRHPGFRLIDVRSPQEYTGELLHMVNYPQEGAQRGGHIPGAKNIPWATAANADGTFKSAEELRQLYVGKDITPDAEVIAYCRIGERSAHTWFVLTRLLGYPRVRNYDGSWTEWGSLVRAPIEKP